jgi:hypothetical protein
MKVKELLTEEPLAAYVSRLAKEHGIKELGSGMFSKVFQHPKLGDVVVKVVSNKDRNFIRYLTWAIEHQDNPFVPKLLDIHSHGARRKDKFTIVFMEKLKRPSHANLSAKLDKLFGVDNVLDSLESARIATNQVVLRKALRNKELDPNLREVLKYLLDEHGEDLDMHDGNFMLRGGQVVFIDPVLSAFDYDNPAPLWYDKRYE